MCTRCHSAWHALYDSMACTVPCHIQDTSENENQHAMPYTETCHIQEISENEILLVLLKTAQFEFQVKQMFQKLLDTKDEKWKEYKDRSCEHMTELAEYFSGEKPLARVAKDESLQAWFLNIGEKVWLLGWQTCHAVECRCMPCHAVE